MPKGYNVPGEQIGEIYDAAVREMEKRPGAHWSEISAAIMPQIASSHSITGIESLPSASGQQVIILANHPTHFEYFFGEDILRARPDLKAVARVPHQEKFPSRTQFLQNSDSFLPLESASDGGYVCEGIETLIRSLRIGTSMIIVPWGGMDIQASNCPLEEAVQNVLRIAKHARGRIVPLSIDISSRAEPWPGPLPFDSVDLTLGEPLSTADSEGIRRAVEALYRKATE